MHHPVFHHFSTYNVFETELTHLANVPFIGKPSNWFLRAKCMKKHL